MIVMLSQEESRRIGIILLGKVNSIRDYIRAKWSRRNSDPEY